MTLCRLHVWGDYACFTRPEYKAERVSYEVMTPAAARGILESILWAPDMTWRVRRIDVLKPIRWLSLLRNELDHVTSVYSLRAALRQAKPPERPDIRSLRQQRHARILVDVAYVIEAAIEVDATGEEECRLQAKYGAMFQRRTRKGACFSQPYLGCREFAAYFRPLTSDERPVPIPLDKALGLMFMDYAYARGGEAMFAETRLTGGSLHVPPEVTRC